MKIIPLLLPLLVIAGPVAAQLACGTIVRKGEKVTLTADIGPCDGGQNDAAVFVDGGTLDLGGRTVFCSDVDESGGTAQGIGLLGKKSRVTNGTVVGCANGIFLAGQGKHLVQGVTVRGSLDDGLDSNDDAPKNKVVDSTFTNNGGDGLHLDSDKNTLRGVSASGNAGDGIDLTSSADKNKVVKSVATANGDDGIEIGGEKNKVIDCTSTDNVEDGVDFGDTKNLVRGGTSQRNGDFDLKDCAGNKVKKLSFTTASADCQ